ncbi:MAG: hypothetical protein H0W20_16685 [Chthoniobacterales bacterium]|nr:hypothetical protein [Chthoniobacterales bacterium]
MTLSFSQLESARRNPAKFGASQTGSGFYNSNNFRTYLIASINRFHRGDTKEQVLEYFEERCRAKLTLLNYFETRLNHYKDVIAGYCDGFGADGSVFVETNKKTALVVANHILKGRIDRFDLRVPAGYRLTAAQLREGDWQSELRWPLIQRAIATELNCPSDEVEVGTFCFETGRHEHRVFSDSEIDEAQAEAEAVLTTVAIHLPGLP